MPKKRDHTFEMRFFESIIKNNPTATDALELLASLYSEAGRLTDSLKIDRRLVRLQPANPTAHYNLACSLALTHRKRDALRSLEYALHLGYDDYAWMIEDPDLDTLKDDARFRTLLASLPNQS